MKSRAAAGGRSSQGAAVSGNGGRDLRLSLNCSRQLQSTRRFLICSGRDSSLESGKGLLPVSLWGGASASTKRRVGENYTHAVDDDTDAPAVDEMIIAGEDSVVSTNVLLQDHLRSEVCRRSTHGL